MADCTTMRLTSDELEALSEYTEQRFGEGRRVPRGVAVRLLAEEAIEDSGE